MSRHAAGAAERSRTRDVPPPPRAVVVASDLLTELHDWADEARRLLLAASEWDALTATASSDLGRVTARDRIGCLLADAQREHARRLDAITMWLDDALDEAAERGR